MSKRRLPTLDEMERIKQYRNATGCTLVEAKRVVMGLPDVHTEHCCSKHGCKYADPTCTVATGQRKQSFPCELCSDEEETRIDLKRVLMEVGNALVLEHGFDPSPRPVAPAPVVQSTNLLVRLAEFFNAHPEAREELAKHGINWSL